MRFLYAFALFIVSTLSISAQEGWTVVDNCMGELSYPVVAKGNWDFSGLIISSAFPDGIRAIRADQNVDYYIALESADTFPAAGAISPNGRYFAYPIGNTDFSVNTMGQDIYGVDFLRIVRSDGNTEETQRFEVNNYEYSGIDGSFLLPPTLWFGNDWVYYPRLGEEDILFNVQTGETKALDISVRGDELRFVSPDGSRAFSDSLYDIEKDTSLSYPKVRHIFWFPDSSAFMASDGETVSIVGRDGELLDTLEQVDTTEQVGFIDIAISPNSQFFAMWDQEQNLFIGDMQTKQIHNLCFQGTLNNPASYYLTNLAWSPDSRSLAFSYENYLVILELETFSNQILDHYSGQVMAWASLEGEIISETEIAIREPQLAPTPIPEQTPEATEQNTVTTGTCQLEVITGANLRAGAGVSFEQLGSAAVGFTLTADAQEFNATEYFRWWHLTTGEWIREDFTRESVECESLPEQTSP